MGIVDPGDGTATEGPSWRYYPLIIIIFFWNFSEGESTMQQLIWHRVHVSDLLLHCLVSTPTLVEQGRLMRRE